MSRQSRKLSPQELSQRIIALETVYGQKGAAKKLGISPDSLRRYRDGKRQAPENVYQKINQKYNRTKTRIEPEKVQARITNITRRQYGAKQGKVENRFAPIYPDYIAAITEQFPIDEKALALLESLSERGYVAAWTGGTEIPVEVQFVLYGENTKRFGKRPIILGIITPYYSAGNGKGKSKKDDESRQSTIREFPIAARTARDVLRLEKRDDYLTRIQKISDFGKENLAQKIDKANRIDQIIGFYFDEDDEE